MIPTGLVVHSGLQLHWAYQIFESNLHLAKCIPVCYFNSTISTINTFVWLVLCGSPSVTSSDVICPLNSVTLPPVKLFLLLPGLLATKPQLKSYILEALWEKNKKKLIISNFQLAEMLHTTFKSRGLSEVDSAVSASPFIDASQLFPVNVF